MASPYLPSEPPPTVTVDPVVRCGAGRPAALRVTVTNTAPEPRALAVHALGVDATWLPMPVRTRPLLPGQTQVVELTLVPALGTLAARYPLTVAVQALDPVRFTATSAAELAPLTLVVDAPGEVGLALEPAEVTTAFGRRMEVVVTNHGDRPAEVILEVQAPAGAGMRLRDTPFTVDGRASVRVPGRIQQRPRLLGSRTRYPYAVTAHSGGAPRTAEGSVTSRPLLGGSLARAVAILTVVALWAVAAVVAIPRLADLSRSDQAGTAAERAAAPGGAGGAGGTGGSGGGGGGGGSGGAGGSGGSASAGGGGAGGGGAGGAGSKVRLNGTVRGADPDGVSVSLRPTSLVEESAQGATVVGAAARTAASVKGLAPEATFARDRAGRSAPRATVTKKAGTWSFPAVNAPGYYLLVFAKAGYQTQRYVIDSAQTDATQPLDVALVTGQGRLTGRVSGPAGAVKGGQVSITDGVNTITTSTNSTGAVGSWSVDGLSTPSTYLVSVSKSGLGAESKLVSLDAGGASQVSLALQSGVSALTGRVRGDDDRGLPVGLGGARVSATKGTVTRTATTVTKGSVVGGYALPGLEPGRWTVTVEADGFQTQTQSVTITAGRSSVRASAVLTRSTASLTGFVRDLASKKGQEGAGIILTNPSTTYKTLTGTGGTFTINGLAAGTYVLSADLFGYTTAYATVTLSAGSTTRQDVTLRYLGAALLPSTAQIRIAGLQDAASRGPLVCEDADDQPVACAVTITTDPDATGTDARTYTDLFNAADIGSQGYVVPKVPDPPPDPLTLLQPGLHTVKVSVPGYESVSVPVQVPIGATTTPTVTVTVPTLSLYPAPRLLGTVSAVVGSPTGLVVRATEVGGSNHPAVTTTVNSVTGAYEMTLPEHGTYQVEVIAPAGSDYRSVPATPLTFALGEVRRYDAVIHRYGQILVTVVAPDATTGLLSVKADALVAVTDAQGNPVKDAGGQTVGPVKTDEDGFAVVRRLEPGAYRLKVQGGAQPLLPAGGLTVRDDQSPAITLVLVNPTQQIVGRVVSQVRLDGTSSTGSTGVLGATVTVSGVVGYNGTTPDVRSTKLTSDANGCFAVTKDTATAPADVGDCKSLSGAAVGALAVVTPQATFAIEAAGYRPVVLANQSVSGSLLTIVLTPEPAQISGTLELKPAQPGGTDLSRAVVSVVKPAVGAGRVSISVDPTTGALSWLDSNYGIPGQVWPGTYQVAATLPGYTPTTASVTCGLRKSQDTGTCTLSLTLEKLGSVVVKAQVVDTTKDPAQTTTLTGVTFTLTGDEALPVTQTAPAGAESVTFTGISSDPDPPYVVRVQAAGYAFADTTTLSFSCTGGPPGDTAISVSPGGTTTCTITVVPLGSITGTTYGILAKSPATKPSQPVGNVTLTARQCKPVVADADACSDGVSGPAFSAVSAASGRYTIRGTAADPGLQAGWWKVSASANGYGSVEVAVEVVQGTPTEQAIDLRASEVTLQVGVRIGTSDQDTKLGKDEALVLVDPDGTKITSGTFDDKTNLYVFTNLIPTSYTLQITGPTINLASQQVSLTVGVSPQTVRIYTDLRTSIVSGSVLGPQGADPPNRPLAGATVSLGTGTSASFKVSDGANGKPLTTSTDATDTQVAGYFSFSTVPDGTFVVKVHRDGYVDSYGSVTVAKGSTTPALSITLTRVTHAVVVTVVSTNGFELGGVPVTLKAVDANPAQGGQTLAAATDDQVTSPAKAWRTTFNAVPSGKWEITIAIGGEDRHFGTLKPAPSTVTVDDQEDGADTAARYELTEVQLDLSVTTTAWPGETPPATVALAVKDEDGDQVYKASAFSTRTSGQSTVTSIWVTAGTYTVTATPPDDAQPAWPTVTRKDIDVSDAKDPTSGDIDLTESPAKAAVTVTLGGKDLTEAATLTLSAADGQTVPGDYTRPVTSTAAGTYTFSGLAPGRWTVAATVSGTPSVVADFTLAAGKTETVPLDIPLSLAVKVTQDSKALTATATVVLAPAAGQADPPTVPAGYASTSTDTGVLSYYALPAGRWTLTATVGSKKAEVTVTVVKGEAGDGGDGKVVPINVPK